MLLPATVNSDPIPEDGGYSFDEARPIVAGLVDQQLRRYPRFAEDINQAALLGAWEATSNGPVPFELISAKVKKRVAETIGEIVERRQSTSDVNLQAEEDAEYTGRGYNARKAIDQFHSLPENEKEFLRRVFRDDYGINSAADELRVGRAQALRLYRKYKALLADGKPDDSWIDWSRQRFDS